MDSLKRTFFKKTGNDPNSFLSKIDDSKIYSMTCDYILFLERIIERNLRCDFCRGEGEISRDSDGMATEHSCDDCKGTGIIENQIF